MSCIARADMPGPGLAHDRVVHDRVDPARAISGRDARVADVGLDQLGALERAARPARVEPDDRLDLGVALEPGGEERPEVAPHAGDQHPAAGH